jgi:hypothetical protein
MTIKKIVKITNIIRLKSTINGNPRYRIEWFDACGVSGFGFTAPNSDFACGIRSGMTGYPFFMNAHTVNLGSNGDPRVRIDDLTPVNQ